MSARPARVEAVHELGTTWLPARAACYADRRMEEDLVGVQEACPECGRRREDWTEGDGRGYPLEGVGYCSERCAFKARARGA